jgi:hypothetical protein
LNIDKDDDRKMFVIDFGLKIEIAGNSIIDDYLLENQDVPIPICNENFTLPGTSIKTPSYICNIVQIKNLFICQEDW